ncbi:MAG: hypothetical protein Q7T55_06855 [Solirubrobacteraceae bacterium]|nr:hypothetical protein [Solirubrobacteraceae bacterium]
MRRPRLQRGVEFLILTAAATVGLAWALPAAAIGLMLGLVLILQGIDARPLRWLARLARGSDGEPGGIERSSSAASDRMEGGTSIATAIHLLWIALIAAGCAAVAYLGAQDALGRAYEYIPALVPFQLLCYAVPGVVRGGPARST